MQALPRLKLLALSAFLVLSGPLFFMLTNPDSLPLGFFVLPFLWVFSCLFTLSWLTLRNRPSINKKKLIIVCVLVATSPVLLLVFQSIHQLIIRDVVIMLGLVSLAVVYVVRADFIK